MVYTLENKNILININAIGAELTSLKTKKNKLEYMWEAVPEVWGRHAPVLFPIVGKLKNNSYSFQGKVYSLPQHGFARDKAFNLLKRNANSISLQLSSDHETLKVYPFHFELTTTYTLEGNKVIVHHLVENKDTTVMYFSIGAHPGFRCPLLNEKFDDCYLEFEAEEDFVRHKIKDGLLSRDQEDVHSEGNIIPLKRDLFKDDALVFKHLRSKYLTLKNKNNNHQVKVSVDGFPFLGIWTKLMDNASFICIEPWLGIADHIDSTAEITQKEGIIKLGGLKTLICSFSIEVQ